MQSLWRIVLIVYLTHFDYEVSQVLGNHNRKIIKNCSGSDLKENVLVVSTLGTTPFTNSQPLSIF